MRMYLNSEIEVLIVSAGGVGTSFLAEAISKFKNTNQFEDEDGYKHLPFPPLSRAECKIIYVMGDPIIATLSLFRRDFQHWQSLKLQRFYFKRSVIPLGQCLEEYARVGIDGFCFERHHHNWSKRYLSNPTLFVKYESIHDSVSQIREFLDLPIDFEDTFPARVERQSKVESLDVSVAQGLSEISSRYSSIVNGLPDCELRMPASQRAWPVWLSPRYWLAFCVEIKNLLKRR